MISLYFTGFRLGVKINNGWGGYIRTYRLGWFNIAIFDRKAARMALRAPKEGRLIIKDVDGERRLQPCSLCREYYDTPRRARRWEGVEG